ncbi:uncharacterized protein LOC122853996 [Aphidius gifuensis]|uniref:uncharacterized protein LOC122853996 n=1 Tax=Aphidius gifuensis TaxID=684658 RepID=UPI001CDD1849|nr:uncharacterized protein LOC122853996 [Aphidius gifuensis]
MAVSCFCFDLRKGTIIISCILIFFNLFLILQVIINPKTEFLDKLEYDSMKMQESSLFYLLVTLVNVIYATTLWGAIKKKASNLVAFLILTGCFAVYCILSIFLEFFRDNQPTRDIKVEVISGIMTFFLWTFLFIFVYKFYKQLRNNESGSVLSPPIASPDSNGHALV